MDTQGVKCNFGITSPLLNSQTSSTEITLQDSRASSTQKRTRIQQENEQKILNSALEVFSKNGFRGSTIDQIAEISGMSKPNLLYYFKNKEAIITVLIDQLLDIWLSPLKEIDPDGDPLVEIKRYIDRKLEMSRDFPRESRLFANEILQGAPRIRSELEELKRLVDEKAVIIRGWVDAGKLADCDPYHLLFSIWATTQHYADFDVQVRTVLDPEKAGPQRFDDAAKFLNQLYVEGLRPKGK